MAVHEVNAVLELTNEQEERMDQLIQKLRKRGDWTVEKILSFTFSGLIGDMVDEIIGRFEQVVEAGERQAENR